MKKINSILLLLILSTSLLYSVAPKQPQQIQQPTQLILFVNIGKVRLELSEIKDFNEWHRKEHQLIEKMDNRLRELYEKRNEVFLNENINNENKDSLIKQIENEIWSLDLERTQKFNNNVIDKANEFDAYIVDKIKKTILAIGQKRKPSALIPSSDYFYIDPKYDITNELIELLNREYEANPNNWWEAK